MNALQEQSDGRLNRFIESHDPMRFFRPEDLSTADPPAEASRLTEPLRLGQIRLATLQRPLGPLLVLDVVAHAIPSDHLSILVAKRYAAHQMPPIFAVGSPPALFHLERLAGRQVSAPGRFDQREVIRVDRASRALSVQAVLGTAGIGSPGSIHEIERAVASISRNQCRNGIDRYLKLSLGLANALFRFLSFGVLNLQRFVEVFELLNGRPQIVARASERFRRAPLRDADPNHEKSRHRKKGEARYVLSDKRIRWRNEIVIESQNGESGCEQTRAGAAKPRGEQDRAQKQGHERDGLQKPVQQYPGDGGCRDRQDRDCVAQDRARRGWPQRTGSRHASGSSSSVWRC